MTRFGETGGRAMPVLMEVLTSGFHPRDQMLRAEDLRRSAFHELRDRVARAHKLLVTHRGEPELVVLEYSAYEDVLRYVQQLEERLEEAELYARFAARFRAPAHPDEYVAADEALGALDGRADARDP